MEHIDKADIIISDTDFTSPLAHNYAERWLLPDFNIYNWMVDEYIHQLEMKNLGLADYYIYLDVSFEERLKHREEDFQRTGRKRNDMFFTQPFPQNMRRFHYIMINNQSPRKCLPSVWYENNPLSVIESLCMGTPVVGAEVGGIPELIRDGDGRLFRMGDKDELVEAVEAVMSVGNLNRQAISERAQKRFSEARTTA